jgi:uncharacterized protein
VTASLPLFPLQAVLLPGATLPLHIFEPRYRQLIVELVTGVTADRHFGVIALKPSLELEVTALSQLREVGCSALLRQVKRLPDGRFDIVSTGDRRFRLLDIDLSSKPYLVGQVEWIPDTDRPASGDGHIVLGQLLRTALSAHRRYCRAAWQREDWTQPPENADAGRLAHLLAADCLLTIEDRQQLLEETRPLHRLCMIGQMLNREAGILTALRAVPAPPSEYHTELSAN